MKTILLGLALTATSLTAAGPASTAAGAINGLGIDLLRTTEPGNALLSPYSIQSALAMTFAGADGVTHTEMAKVLHYPPDETEVHRSFAVLRQELAAIVGKSSARSQQSERTGTANDPITLTVANRLFGQSGFEFRPAFLALVNDNSAAPFMLLDFRKDAGGATRRINTWVEDQTHQHIRDLIPSRALDESTRLVLVNAIYLKAPWTWPFETTVTAPRGFRLADGRSIQVPTMKQQHGFGYAKGSGFTAITLPYDGGDLQFLVLLPDRATHLAAIETRLTVDLLADCARLKSQELILHLPIFKLEPPTLKLSGSLRALGMNSAFDQPRGSANFDRIALRQGGAYFAISEVFHKTFLKLDEKGTEAAAATAVSMLSFGTPDHNKPKPIEVKVDRPFLFAIQHRWSGACLFLGRVMDPR